MPDTAHRITTDDWPDPLELLNPDGRSPVLLVCEHASRHIPSEYEGLGLADAELDRHIAWDIGAGALTRQLSTLLDAPAFLCGYSRLLIDLNRPLDAASSIPKRSEATDIPGNSDLTAQERQRRADRIFTPFHDAVASAIDARRAQGKPMIIVAVHSFTPVFLGKARPWHVGVLYGKSEALGMRVVARLKGDTGLNIGVNEPYVISQQEDYALPVHGDRQDIPAVLIEVRNDELVTDDGISAWAERLAGALRAEAMAA